MNSAEGLAFGGKQNEEIKHASAKPINSVSLRPAEFLVCWGGKGDGSEDKAKRVHPTALEHTSARDRLQGPVPLPSPFHSAGALLILV